MKENACTKYTAECTQTQADDKGAERPGIQARVIINADDMGDKIPGVIQDLTVLATVVDADAATLDVFRQRRTFLVVAPSGFFDTR